MQNPYCPLSADSWNQTLRKSQIFHDTFARKKIRAPRKSFFEDQIAGIRDEWEKGEMISLEEIVTLKLYTDFDVLQNGTFASILLTFYIL